jgi:hypothetical protein
MRTHTLLWPAALFAAALGGRLASPAPAQPTTPTQPAKPAPTPPVGGVREQVGARIEQEVRDMTRQAQSAVDQLDEQTRKWLEASTPGERHQALAKLEGRWSAKLTFWTGPDAPAQNSEGAITNTIQLDGRFVRQQFEGQVMGMPMKGEGYLGFDNPANEFVGLWMDTLGTGVQVHRGSPGPDANTITLRGEFKDLAGRPVASRHVITFLNNDRHVFEIYHAPAGTPEFRSMRAEYTRIK